MTVRNHRTIAQVVRDLPIARKLMVITVVTTASALMLAGTGIVVSDSLLFRGYLARDLSTLAQITAENTTAALAFDDPAAASEILYALRARQHLVAACIYRPNGSVLATYLRLGSPSSCPPMNNAAEINFASGNVIVSRPVMLRDKRVGSLTFLYDLNEISERTRLYGLMVLAVLLASSLAGYFLTSSLREIIATPLAQLVEATTKVSKTGDYGIRSRKFSEDELGVLVDAFNGMLASIQIRDLELTQALAAREAAFADLAQSNEKLARSNDDLERFAFVASHDLQEPLRMITIFSQLLVREHSVTLSTEAGSYLANINSSAKRMRTLLSDLLAYTDAGAPASQNSRPVDLNLVLLQALDNLKAAILETDAVITFDRFPFLHAYEGHFISLFQNLISNALKYRSEKPPQIHVGYERKNGFLKFSVQDNGIGIDPEYHAKIFVVFKRLHGQNIAGTGIGLAICQRVVERYKGKIQVESQLNRGAKFIVTLPAELAAREEEFGE